ncbi:hypothetical protein FisN_1Hh118 [Fistulifera solaris]|uniref:Uncharacterized protein n=1 Tax=Fistulifera solaris TaxID=1519565 RepID=A0A1Z5JE87_FISSO|nr:hypothetical protein FisN_1Hh118 [Fistulifera solaris]|eukprot:GAX12192.1 hypothetical protein FisN_1Hh118 [Fistulifera solaris]
MIAEMFRPLVLKLMDVLKQIGAFIWIFLASTPNLPGSSEECPIQLKAVPGLITFLDVALFRSSEAQLSASLITAHALLQSWLTLQKNAAAALLLSDELTFSEHQWVRQCFDIACDAVALLTIDPLASSANLSDPYDIPLGGVSKNSAGITAVQQDGRKRQPAHQRRRDCWESPRLYCPDYIWAEHVYNQCQKQLRQLNKLQGRSSSSKNQQQYIGSKKNYEQIERDWQKLTYTVQVEIPNGLARFRAAFQADATVLKRLYLIKCEYRAPFRAYLEAHYSIRKAPSLTLVEQLLQEGGPTKSNANLENQFQKLLSKPNLVESLALEQKCAEFEQEMTDALYPFAELARYLDHKKVQLVSVPGVLGAARVPRLKEHLRRLLKAFHGNSAGGKQQQQQGLGIRSILLDLLGFLRDEHLLTRTDDTAIVTGSLREKVEAYVDDITTLATLCTTRNAFRLSEYKRHQDQYLDVPSNIVRGCTQFDRELFVCQCIDWDTMVQRQNELSDDLEELAGQIHQAEMRRSLAGTTSKSLQVVKQRLENLIADRGIRLQVLQGMLEEVCLREMNIYVSVSSAPDDQAPLCLPTTSEVGVFGKALQLDGYPLPVG